MGLLNTDPAVRMNASFSPVCPPAGHDRACRRRAARSASPSSRLAAERQRRPVGVRQRRQQGRRVEQRSAGVLGGRPADARDPALSRVVREPAPVRAAGAAHRPDQADRRAQGGAHPGRLARGGQPHRGARRKRRRGRRPVPAVRRHPRRHDRRDVRHRRLPRRPAAAGRARASRSSPTPAGPASSPSTRAKPPVSRSRSSAPDARTQLRGVSARRPRASAIPSTWSRRPGPDEYRQAIEVAAHGRRCRCADRHLHAGRREQADRARSPASRTGIAAARRARSSHKPILACVMSDSTDHLPLRVVERDASRRTPFRRTPPGRSARWRPTRRGDRSRPGCSGPSTMCMSTRRARSVARRSAPRRRRGSTDDEVRGVLHAFGVPVAVHSLARTADEAAAFASRHRVSGRRQAGIHEGARTRPSSAAVRLNLATAADVRPRSTTSSPARNGRSAPRRDRRRDHSADDHRRRRNAGRHRRTTRCSVRWSASASAASTSRCSATCGSAWHR